MITRMTRTINSRHTKDFLSKFVNPMREPMHPARCTGSCENTFEKGADDMGLMEIGKYDIVHKGRYEDDLVHEIIPCVDRSFPTSRDRCGTLNRRYIVRE